MTLIERVNKLKPIAEEMGLALYQRFSEQQTAELLNISTDSLKRLREQQKIEFINLPETPEYFGYHILEYLLGAVSPIVSLNQQNPTNDRIIRMKQVVKMTGLSRTTIWRRERDKSFPARVSLGKNSVGWRLSEVQSWLATRE